MSLNSDLRDLFLLEPEIAFLNHGSFGACPKPVFDVYQHWQREMERQPVDFFLRRLEEHLSPSRAALAGLFNTEPANLALIPNATTGINIVARSLELSPGDEILATNHEYGAIDRTWRFIAHKTGAVYRNQAITVPVTTHDVFFEQLWQGVTERTKVIAISHITAPTALIFPVDEVCLRAREAGILTIIDGAHVPGQIDLDLEALGADFYTGNCHKWMCAPKGAAFLYARPAVQPLVEPLIVSWGYQSESPGESTFQDYLGWTGTQDVSAYLAIEAAIHFQEEFEWDKVRQECHDLAVTAWKDLSERIGEPPLCLDGDTWWAQMFALRLPSRVEADELWARLWGKHLIEVPVWSWNGGPLLRVSVQAYNTSEDLERLITALDELL
jgi:isopenicillin-N epimerase